jgi:hypothetical protein
VTAVPTLIVLDGGEVSTRVEVPRSRAAIQTALQPWLR